MSADLGNSFEEGSCLQEFQSMPGPVGVQNQESGLPRTDAESSQSGVVPSMSGNDYTVPIAISPTVPPESIDPFAAFLPRGLHASMTRYSRTQPRLYLGKTEDGIRPAAAAF